MFGRTAILSALEQPPVQPAISVRPTPAKRVLHRCDAGVRGRGVDQRPQNGARRVLGLLCRALLRAAVQAPRRRPQRRALRRHEGHPGVHVPRGSERRAGAARRPAQGGGDPQSQGARGRERGLRQQQLQGGARPGPRVVAGVPAEHLHVHVAAALDVRQGGRLRPWPRAPLAPALAAVARRRPGRRVPAGAPAAPAPAAAAPGAVPGLGPGALHPAHLRYCPSAAPAQAHVGADAEPRHPDSANSPRPVASLAAAVRRTLPAKRRLQPGHAAAVQPRQRGSSPPASHSLQRLDARLGQGQ